MDLFSALPIELPLKHVLPNLDLPDICRLSQVSTTWRSHVKNYFSMLKQLDLHEFNYIMTESGFSSIILQLSKLENIYLRRCWKIASKSNLLALSLHCPCLKRFYAERCKDVDDEVLEELAKNCPSLECIDVSSCFQITDAGVKAIFKHCKSLKTFFASKNYCFTDAGVMFIGRNCKTLQELDIGSCIHVSDLGLQKLLDGKCKKLSYLRIKDCYQVSEEMVQKLVARGIIVNNCF